MTKSTIVLLCLSVIGLGVAPITQAQTVSPSGITIIRGVSPDVTGRSSYDQRYNYRNYSDYHRPAQTNIIIINNDSHRYDDPSRFYRRGRGQTYGRDTMIQRGRIYQPMR
jgi:hypothetical protein